MRRRAALARRGGPGDAAGVAGGRRGGGRLRAAILREGPERLGRYGPWRVRQRPRGGFDAAHTWGIEVGGTFAGRVAPRPAADAHWLEHLHPAPDVQGGGVGSGVPHVPLERCDRDGLRVRLNVPRGSAARRLYERHGFTVESEDTVDVFLVRPPSSWVPPRPDRPAA